MKRIIVIGCPGSGKSRFSRMLSEKTGIPLCHLDMLFWNSDRTNVTREVFLERLQQVLKNDSWIIDGNYSFSMEKRLSLCDTVFFFDLPTKDCIKGVFERRGETRSDLPWNEADYPVDDEFLEFIRSFNGTNRNLILELLSKYPDVKTFTFTERGMADDFIKRL